MTFRDHLCFDSLSSFPLCFLLATWRNANNDGSVSVSLSLCIKLLRPLLPLFIVSTLPTPWIMSLVIETSSPDTIQHSLTSSITRVSENEKVDVPQGEVEEALGKLELEWENDPDNARNWSFEKKWTVIAIVSALASPYLFNWIFFCITGVVLHIRVSTRQFNDGTRFTRDCDQVWDNKCYCCRFDFEHIFACLCPRCLCYFILIINLHWPVRE